MILPVFINEVITEVAQAVVPEVRTAPVEDQMPISDAEYELMQTLSLLEERQQRLQFD